jgi:hypothetical protein
MIHLDRPECKLLSAKHNVSFTFHENRLVDSRLPDFVILSKDGIFFYAHRHRLHDFPLFLVALTQRATSVSGNPDVQRISFPESSHVLSILLHDAYGLEEINFLEPPPLVELIDAVSALEKYGFVPVAHYITPSSTVFQLFTHHASLPCTLSELPVSRPNLANPALLIYILAAKHDLEDLAVVVSSGLLSFPLYTLTDEDAVQLGALYMRRLFQLQLTRTEALKALLCTPPCSTSEWFMKSASSKHTCDLGELDKMTRAWALASSYVILTATPDLEVHALDSILRPLGDDLSCSGCKRLWAERVYETVARYGSLKVKSLRYTCMTDTD